MQLHGQAQALGRLKHAPRVRRREADVFAERVHGIDQALGMELGHPVANGVDVGVGLAVEFGRQRVGAQEGGAHVHAERLAQGAGHAQAAGLGVK